MRTRFLLPLMLAALLPGCASITSQVAHIATTTPMTAASYEPLTGDSWAWAYRDLWTRLEAAGITLEEVPHLVNPHTESPVWGLTYRAERRIQVEGSIDINGRFEILCHEAGHLFHNAGMSTAHAEVFAETVGANVQAFYGVPHAALKSGRYLASYKYGLPVLPYLRADIDQATRALTGRLPWRTSN